MTNDIRVPIATWLAKILGHCTHCTGSTQLHIEAHISIDIPIFTRTGLRAWRKEENTDGIGRVWVCFFRHRRRSRRILVYLLSHSFAQRDHHLQCILVSRFGRSISNKHLPSHVYVCWQYCGIPSSFPRHWPAIKWPKKEEKEKTKSNFYKYCEDIETRSLYSSICSINLYQVYQCHRILLHDGISGVCNI